MLRIAYRKFADWNVDLAVLGGGPGGYLAAIKASQLGLSTVVIEGHRNLGGTSVNGGCIPTQALLECSNKFAKEGHYDGIVYAAEHWKQTQGQNKFNIDRQSHNISRLFEKNGVETIPGWGSFTGPNSLDVHLRPGVKDTVEAKNIIVATGSVPTPLPNLPFDHKRIISSSEALALTEIPNSLIVVGAGTTGLEIASIYYRFGTQVTIFEESERIANTMDARISEHLYQSLMGHGMNIKLNCKVVGGKNKGNRVVVEYEQDGQTSTRSADYVLVATGRHANTANINCESAGVDLDKYGRVVVNDDCMVPNSPHIAAIGDCVRGPMVRTKAEEEGVFVAKKFAGKGGQLNYQSMPAVLHTFPEYAMLGQTEEQLIQHSKAYNRTTFPFKRDPQSGALVEENGIFKILSDPETDQILGVHALGEHAEAIVREAVLGVLHKEGKYASEEIREAAHKKLHKSQF